jgi:hypothetical protein
MASNFFTFDLIFLRYSDQRGWDKCLERTGEMRIAYKNFSLNMNGRNNLVISTHSVD